MPILLSLLLALLLLVSPPAHAQAYLGDRVGASPRHASAGEAEAVIHITDRINRHPAARAGLDAYAHRLPAAAKAGTSYQIGQQHAFKVYNVSASRGDLTLDRLDFTLMSEDAGFRLWIETAELENGHVRQADVEELRETLSSRTPKRSIAPASGILANDETYFGAPPDVDGDGATDVLLVDIRDGYEPGEGYVAGFVWHGDLDPAGTHGNGRDVLYIDTYPGIHRDDALHDTAHHDTRHAEATAAHEYQHLIHLAYDRDEATFVNEGLSEWAEAANGYVDHPVTYLSRPAAHTAGLLDWHEYEPALRLDDYERAGLFTTYLAQRVGAERLRELVQARSGGRAMHGAEGYRALLQAAGLSLADVVTDFHTANLVNDRAIVPAYGYADPVHRSMPIIPTREVDGRESLTNAADGLTLRPGGVAYLSWRYVADFQFRVRGNAALRVRAVATHTDGRVEIRDVKPGGLRMLSGDFNRVVLVVVHPIPDGDPISASAEAVWKEGGASGIHMETLAYDDGEARSFFALNGGADGAQATAFAVPKGNARLTRIAVAPYFANQFAGSFLSEDEQRDLEVQIWKPSLDGGPGDLLLSIPMLDPRPYASAARTLRFFDVDLAPYESVLSHLPDTVYIGLVNAGTDANHLVGAVADYAPKSVSYTGNLAAGTWKPLWAVQLFGSDEPYPMLGTAIPIRAEFVVTGEPAPSRIELPDAIALEQNYPNPFNPSATIRYRLEQAGNVHLAVYDVTGRRVATLEDGLRGAGTHRVDVDGAAWASGTYVYVLEADGRRAMRTMVLAK